MLRQTFILILAGAFTANAQTLVGSLGAMGIAGTLQSINSTAAINGLNAANGLTGIFNDFQQVVYFLGKGECFLF